MIKALIVDSEPEALRNLDALLNHFCKDVEVAGMANSVNSALELIREVDPRLVFLDTVLKDGYGFEVLERLPERNFSTVFVTASDQYAIKALRLNATDYLLKPIDPAELVNAVERVRERERYSNYTPLMNSNPDGEYTRITITGTRRTIYLEINEISRLESSNNYTYIYHNSTKPILVSKTIKTFEELLPEDQFIRCHQRHIVNLMHIKEYIKSGGYLILESGQEIPISRANRIRLDQLLGRKYPAL